MCRCLPLIAFIVFAEACFSYGQSTESLIKNIRSKYESIRNNLNNYDTIAIEVWDKSTEGGEIIGYYKKQDLKLIKSGYFGETGKFEAEYYFDSGKLFFVFEKHYTYNRPIYWDKERAKENNDTIPFDPAKTVIEEARYYFYRERLIRLISPEMKEVDLSVESNAKLGREMISNAHMLRDKLKKND